MSWEKFIEENDIGQRFHNVELSKTIMLHPSHKKELEDFISKPLESLFLFGPTGTGKTYALLSLIKALYKREIPLYWIRYMNVKNLDEEILDRMRNHGTASSFLTSLSQSMLLFIDDFGVDRLSERFIRDIYQIIDYRWSHEKPTVFSSNLKPEEIKKLYGDRIFSRLQEFKWLFLGGKDLRNKKESK